MFATEFEIKPAFIWGGGAECWNPMQPHILRQSYSCPTHSAFQKKYNVKLTQMCWKVRNMVHLRNQKLKSKFWITVFHNIKTPGHVTLHWNNCESSVFTCSLFYFHEIRLYTAHHIGDKMRNKGVKTITSKQNENPVIIDKSMTHVNKHKIQFPRILHYAVQHQVILTN
jgi:hypothetical protein